MDAKEKMTDLYGNVEVKEGVARLGSTQGEDEDDDEEVGPTDYRPMAAQAYDALGDDMDERHKKFREFFNLSVFGSDLVQRDEHGEFVNFTNKGSQLFPIYKIEKLIELAHFNHLRKTKSAKYFREKVLPKVKDFCDSNGIPMNDFYREASRNRVVKNFKRPDGTIMRRLCEDTGVDDKGRPLLGRIYCSAEEVFDYVHEAHARVGHGSGRSTHDELSDRVCNISENTCLLFVRLCPVCMFRKKKIKKHRGAVKPIFSTGFRDRFQMDLIDKSASPAPNIFGVQMNWINVIRDHFTKETWIKAQPKKETKYSAHILMETCAVVGYPSVLQTDNGKEVCGREVLDVIQMLNPNVITVQGRVRTPRDQGAIERENQTICSILDKIQREEFCRLRGLARRNGQPEDEVQQPPWPDLLPRVQEALNARKRRPQRGSNRLKFSPYQATFGMDYHASHGLLNTVDIRKTTNVLDRINLLQEPTFTHKMAVLKEITYKDVADLKIHIWDQTHEVLTARNRKQEDDERMKQEAEDKMAGVRRKREEEANLTAPGLSEELNEECGLSEGKAKENALTLKVCEVNETPEVDSTTNMPPPLSTKPCLTNDDLKFAPECGLSEGKAEESAITLKDCEVQETPEVDFTTNMPPPLSTKPRLTKDELKIAQVTVKKNKKRQIEELHGDLVRSPSPGGLFGPNKPKLDCDDAALDQTVTTDDREEADHEDVGNDDFPDDHPNGDEDLPTVQADAVPGIHKSTQKRPPDEVMKALNNKSVELEANAAMVLSQLQSDFGGTTMSNANHSAPRGDCAPADNAEDGIVVPEVDVPEMGGCTSATSTAVPYCEVRHKFPLPNPKEVTPTSKAMGGHVLRQNQQADVSGDTSMPPFSDFSSSEPLVKSPRLENQHVVTTPTLKALGSIYLAEQSGATGTQASAEGSSPTVVINPVAISLSQPNQGRILAQDPEGRLPSTVDATPNQFVKLHPNKSDIPVKATLETTQSDVPTTPNLSVQDGFATKGLPKESGVDAKEPAFSGLDRFAGLLEKLKTFDAKKIQAADAQLKSELVDVLTFLQNKIMSKESVPGPTSLDSNTSVFHEDPVSMSDSPNVDRGVHLEMLDIDSAVPASGTFKPKGSSKIERTVTTYTGAERECTILTEAESSYNDLSNDTTATRVSNVNDSTVQVSTCHEDSASTLVTLNMDGGPNRDMSDVNYAGTESKSSSNPKLHSSVEVEGSSKSDSTVLTSMVGEPEGSNWKEAESSSIGLTESLGSPKQISPTDGIPDTQVSVVVRVPVQGGLASGSLNVVGISKPDLPATEVPEARQSDDNQVTDAGHANPPLGTGGTEARHRDDTDARQVNPKKGHVVGNGIKETAEDVLDVVIPGESRTQTLVRGDSIVPTTTQGNELKGNVSVNLVHEVKVVQVKEEYVEDDGRPPFASPKKSEDSDICIAYTPDSAEKAKVRERLRLKEDLVRAPIRFRLAFDKLNKNGGDRIYPNLNCETCKTRSGGAYPFLTIGTKEYNKKFLQFKVWYSREYINSFCILLDHYYHHPGITIRNCVYEKQTKKQITVRPIIKDTYAVLSVVHTPAHFAVMHVIVSARIICIYDPKKYRLFRWRDAARMLLWESGIQHLEDERYPEFLYTVPTEVEKINLAKHQEGSWFMYSTAELGFQDNDYACGPNACLTLYAIISGDHNYYPRNVAEEEKRHKVHTIMKDLISRSENVLNVMQFCNPVETLARIDTSEKQEDCDSSVGSYDESYDDANLGNLDDIDVMYHIDTVYDGYECCICQDILRNKKNPLPCGAKLHCGHQFHYQCQLEYFNHGANRRCPICPKDISYDEWHTLETKEAFLMNRKYARRVRFLRKRKEKEDLKKQASASTSQQTTNVVDLTNIVDEDLIVPAGWSEEGDPPNGPSVPDAFATTRQVQVKIEDCEPGNMQERLRQAENERVNRRAQLKHPPDAIPTAESRGSVTSPIDNGNQSLADNIASAVAKRIQNVQIRRKQPLRTIGYQAPSLPESSTEDEDDLPPTVTIKKKQKKTIVEPREESNSQNDSDCDETKKTNEKKRGLANNTMVGASKKRKTKAAEVKTQVSVATPSFFNQKSGGERKRTNTLLPTTYRKLGKPKNDEDYEEITEDALGMRTSSILGQAKNVEEYETVKTTGNSKGNIQNWSEEDVSTVIPSFGSVFGEASTVMPSGGSDLAKETPSNVINSMTNMLDDIVLFPSQPEASPGRDGVAKISLCKGEKHPANGTALLNAQGTENETSVILLASEQPSEDLPGEPFVPLAQTMGDSSPIISHETDRVDAEDEKVDFFIDCLCAAVRKPNESDQLSDYTHQPIQGSHQNLRNPSQESNTIVELTSASQTARVIPKRKCNMDPDSDSDDTSVAAIPNFPGKIRKTEGNRDSQSSADTVSLLGSPRQQAPPTLRRPTLRGPSRTTRNPYASAPRMDDNEVAGMAQPQQGPPTSRRATVRLPTRTPRNPYASAPRLSDHEVVNMARPQIFNLSRPTIDNQRGGDNQAQEVSGGERNETQASGNSSSIGMSSIITENDAEVPQFPAMPFPRLSNVGAQPSSSTSPTMYFHVQRLQERRRSQLALHEFNNNNAQVMLEQNRNSLHRIPKRGDFVTAFGSGPQERAGQNSLGVMGVVANCPQPPGYGIQLASKYGIVNKGGREKKPDGTLGTYRTFPREQYTLHDWEEMYDPALNEIRRQLVAGEYNFRQVKRLTYFKAHAQEHGENRSHGSMRCGCSSKKPGACNTNRCGCRKANRKCTRKCKCHNSCCNA